MEHPFRAVLLCFLGCIAFFLAVPNADMWVSQQFFTPELGFTFDKHPIVLSSYQLFAQMHFWVIGALLVYLAWSFASGATKKVLVNLLHRRMAIF